MLTRAGFEADVSAVPVQFPSDETASQQVSWSS